MNTPKTLARLAGVLYLLMAVLGGYAHLGIRTRIHVPADATTTIETVAANLTLFRFALVADMAMATLFVLVGVTLFRLFAHVNRHAATALMMFVTVGAGMILTNLIFHQAALVIATDPTYDAFAFDALVLLLIELHGYGYELAGIFFGLWLFPLGYLGYQSKLLPRLLSLALIVAGASWIIDTLTGFLFPDLPASLQAVLSAPRITEFWLIGYLCIKGVRTPTGDQLAGATASS